MEHLMTHPMAKLGLPGYLLKRGKGYRFSSARVTDDVASHMHRDHLYGFGRLLRILLGRPRRVRLFGPVGLADAMGHRLAAYT